MTAVTQGGNPTPPILRQSAIWLALAALIGFVVPALFSMGLHWKRPVFLIPYVVLIGGFLVTYFRRQPISPERLLGHWRIAFIGVAVAVLLLLRNIQGQPSSAAPEGVELVLALVWIGLVYGAVDGLFLNVMPVLAIQHAWPHASSPLARVGRGLVALGASVVVTIAYHFGYAEFHGSAMLLVILGNAIITLTGLLTGSPIAAVLTHVIMHVAALLHGMESTLQLPPHYSP